MIDLAGTVVLITGAGGGVGTGLVRAFLDAGASVVAAHNRRLPDPGPDPAPGRYAPIAADLTADDAPDRLIDGALDAFGRLDALINNAASQDVVALDGMEDDQFRAMVETNLTAVHRLTARAVPHLAQRSGSVVHIASIEGTTPAPGHAHYAVTKAAVIMHARAAALEYGRLGVRVNTVSPGLIDRPGLGADWPEGVERWHRAAPLGRLGTPADVAGACLFLCSPLASWITGTDLVVDGGVSTHPHW